LSSHTSPANRPSHVSRRPEGGAPTQCNSARETAQIARSGSAAVAQAVMEPGSRSPSPPPRGRSVTPCLAATATQGSGPSGSPLRMGVVRWELFVHAFWPTCSAAGAHHGQCRSRRRRRGDRRSQAASHVREDGVVVTRRRGEARGGAHPTGRIQGGDDGAVLRAWRTANTSCRLVSRHGATSRGWGHCSVRSEATTSISTRA
jgi:hypothetical protein